MSDAVTRYSVPNPINRDSLGSDNDLKRNADGSFTLYFQHASPGPDKEAKWLSAPAGPFYLILRNYAPVPAAAEGLKDLDTFKEPPPVMPVGQDRVSAAGPERLTGSFAETGWKEDRMNATTYRFAALAATCLIASAPAHAQQAPPDDDQPTGARVDHDTVSKANGSDIAKESQNPVGNLTILPLELLKKLDDLGIADATIIMYSTEAPRTTLGRMARTRRSALRKIRIGKAQRCRAQRPRE